MTKALSALLEEIPVIESIKKFYIPITPLTDTATTTDNNTNTDTANLDSNSNATTNIDTDRNWEQSLSNLNGDRANSLGLNRDLTTGYAMWKEWTFGVNEDQPSVNQPERNLCKIENLRISLEGCSLDKLVVLTDDHYIVMVAKSLLVWFLYMNIGAQMLP
ncbi:hypothetical protein BD770DRAFT_444468 [Pilaira anomala]|nr:hypothetical protein BD770DRAFT_444468 [Pilaira anomala]